MSESAIAPTCAPHIAVLLAKAELLVSADRVAEARAAFQTAIESDPGDTARNEFGCFLTRVGCFDEAVEQFGRVLSAAKTNGDTCLTAAACNNLAAVYRESNQSHLAARWQQQSVEAETRVEHTADRLTVWASDLANLANDAILSGQYDLAERMLFRSLFLELKFGSMDALAADCGSLGVVALLKGEDAKAIVFLWRAYRLHCQLHDLRGAGCDLMNLAQLCGHLGRRQAAVRFLRRALGRFQRAHAANLASRAGRLLQEARDMAEVATRNPLLN